MLTFLAAGGWAWMAGLELRRAWATGSLLTALLALQSGFVGLRLIFRQQETQTAPLFQRLIAWGSVFLLLGMRVEHTTWFTEGLGLLGVWLALWGLHTLGAAFGIAPADRGVKRRGPYEYLRHPMYAGALLSGLGVLATNPSLWNSGIYGLLLVAVLRRIHWEETLLTGYTPYARAVRWRLLPGVW